MNETEAEHYGRKESAEEAAREFAKTAGMAVIKMGKKGSIAVKDGKLYQAAPYTVEASMPRIASAMESAAVADRSVWKEPETPLMPDLSTDS